MTARTPSGNNHFISNWKPSKSSREHIGYYPRYVSFGGSSRIKVDLFYRETLRFPVPAFRLRLIKCSSRHGRANTLIRQGSGEEKYPRNRLSILCFSSPRRPRPRRRGRAFGGDTYTQDDLSRWRVINPTARAGGRAKRRWSARGWFDTSTYQMRPPPPPGVHPSDLYGVGLTTRDR